MSLATSCCELTADCSVLSTTLYGLLQKPFLPPSEGNALNVTGGLKRIRLCAGNLEHNGEARKHPCKYSTHSAWVYSDLRFKVCFTHISVDQFTERDFHALLQSMRGISDVSQLVLRIGDYLCSGMHDITLEERSLEVSDHIPYQKVAV